MMKINKVTKTYEWKTFLYHSNSYKTATKEITLLLQAIRLNYHNKNILIEYCHKFKYHKLLSVIVLQIHW